MKLRDNTKSFYSPFFKLSGLLIQNWSFQLKLNSQLSIKIKNKIWGEERVVSEGGWVRVVTQAAEWRMGILDHCTAHFNGSLLRALVLIARIQILIQGVLKIRKRFLNLALDRSLVLLDCKIENEWKSKTRILGILIMDHTLYFFMKDLPRFSGADTCIGTWKPRKILHEKSSVERQRFYVDSRYIF